MSRLKMIKVYSDNKQGLEHRHSANSSHETSIPRVSGVFTVHILQNLQGLVLNFDYGIYLDYIFSRHFAGVHINIKWSER